MRVVLVDDEKPARDRLRRLLRDHPDFVVVGEAGDVPTAVELLERERPELCLLDVRMPGGDGFDVLLRARHRPRVIFTTAFDRYALRAFEVRSIDYLLKPFRAERLAEALARVRETLAREEPSRAEIARLLEEIRSGLHDGGAEAAPAAAEPAADPGSYLSARLGSRIVLLDPAEVLWFESEQALVFARTAEGRFAVDRTLAELEERLGDRFFRAHRGCLVNLSRVGEIRPHDSGTYQIVLRDPERTVLPLSRRQARRLRERIRW